MRKGLFAVMLVAASFAGGAVVNGPGLRWARAMILKHPDGDGTASSDEVILPPPNASESIPSAPLPPLVVEPASPDASRLKDHEKGKDGPKVREEDDAPSPPPPLPMAAEPAPEPKAPAPPEPKVPAPLGPSPSGLGGESRAAEPSKGPPVPLDELPPLEMPVEPSAPKGQGPAARDEPWGDAPGSAPSAAIPPRPYHPAKPDPRLLAAGVTTTAAGPTSAPKPGPESGSGAKPLLPGDWAQIRRTMSALGVARYGIEGEPGGRVRFHCVIPLAGRRAVGQHFEADGDDEFQAAQVALRRVALWRAGQDPSP